MEIIALIVIILFFFWLASKTWVWILGLLVTGGLIIHYVKKYRDAKDSDQMANGVSERTNIGSNILITLVVFCICIGGLNFSMSANDADGDKTEQQSKPKHHKHKDVSSDEIMMSNRSFSTPEASSSSSEDDGKVSEDASRSHLMQMDATDFPSQARADAAVAPIRDAVGSLTWNGAGSYDVNGGVANFGNITPNGRSWVQSHADGSRIAMVDAYLTKQARQYQNRNQTGNGASDWKPAGFMQASDLPGHWKYAYNRGHLVGYAIAGNVQGFDASEANPNNIVTETSWANQARSGESRGENYYEQIVRKALDQNKTLRYRVSPVYAGNEQVPRGIHMEAQSSDGTVNFNVLIPNAQNNILINYQDGMVTRCTQ